MPSEPTSGAAIGKMNRARKMILGILVAVSYTLWIVNGWRFGFSLSWLSMGLFLAPTLLWAAGRHLQAGRRPIRWSPRETIALGVLGSLGLGIGAFDFIGWGSLIFPLILLPAAAAEAVRQANRGSR